MRVRLVVKLLAGLVTPKPDPDAPRQGSLKERLWLKVSRLVAHPTNKSGNNMSQR
ncbi:hypothetical protein L6R49_07525 [Myxococcota bacterium]|nr:hypothetical protein [Myxococcota bacterium]